MSKLECKCVRSGTVIAQGGCPKHGILRLREAVNVTDLLERDVFVRRMKQLRAEVAQQKIEVEAWNLDHPEAKPVSTAWEDEMIDYCDGKRAGIPEVPEL